MVELSFELRQFSSVLAYLTYTQVSELEAVTLIQVGAGECMNRERQYE